MRHIFTFLALTSLTPLFGQAQFFPQQNIFDPAPINGICGVKAGQTRESWPRNPWDTNALCLHGEVDEFRRTNINSVNLNQTQQFSRRCKWLNGWSSMTCTAQGTRFFYTNALSTSCGTAQGTPMMTTIAIPGYPFSNVDNVFLGNLCRHRTNSGDIIHSAPVVFNSTPLGRVWQCPTYIGDPIECSTPRYIHGLCGAANNTGHTNVPTANLCAPWSVASIVQFDTQSQLWRRTCRGEGNGNIWLCHARPRFDTSTLQPTCNPHAVTTTGGMDVVSTFPGNDGCRYGTIGYWVVSANGQAQRRCKNNNLETLFCANATFGPWTGALGTQCNQAAQRPFPTSHELIRQGLCTDGYPKFFQDLGNSRSWICGEQVCEAPKSAERLCGRAMHEPTKMAPTNGMCQSWAVMSLAVRSTEDNRHRERQCRHIQTQEVATCQTLKITDGKCNLATTLRPEGRPHPSAIIANGMCEFGIADPQWPRPDLTWWVRRRSCLANNPWWQADQCQARVRLPDLSIVYDKPRPSSWLLAWPVIARVTWYDPAYISFTNPLNQDFWLFTTTGQVAFHYRDRAGNTGMIAATVDWINPQILGANLRFIPNGPSSGTISVWVTGVTHPLADFTFQWSCLTQNLCRLGWELDPHRRTVIFSGNAQGTITLRSITWLTLNLPVAVTGIDRTPPIVSVVYSTIQKTNLDVHATLTGWSEEIIVLNNSWAKTYVFTGNGAFTFKVADRAGNQIDVVARVDNIHKVRPTATVTYSSTGVWPWPITAILGNFSTTGIRVVNNSWSNMYTFQFNETFEFVIEDPRGNRNIIPARVDWIRRGSGEQNGLKMILNHYNEKICAKFRKRYPVDIQGNENNLAIMTMLHNCIMRWFDDEKTGITYFYPRNNIRRGEFLTIVGRTIRLLADFDNPNIQTLSHNFIGVHDRSQFGPEITQADARWLLMYSPLMQSWTTKVLNLSWFVSFREAKYILTDAFKLVGADHRILEYGMHEVGMMTRWDLAFILNHALTNRDQIIIWANNLFLQALYEKIRSYPYADQRKIMIQLVSRMNTIPEQTFQRLGLRYPQLREDLIAASQERIPTRQTRPFFNIRTIMDHQLRKIIDPSNNEIFNDKHLYINMMER